MARDDVSVARYDRTGELVTHGTDIDPRPDAVQFRARSNQVLVDWAGELHVWIDRWCTRAGVAVLLHQEAAMEGQGIFWVLQASAMPFDAIGVRAEQQVRLVFSEYVPLTAGETYRIVLPGAVVTKPEIHLVAVQRDPACLHSRGAVHRRRVRRPA